MTTLKRIRMVKNMTQTQLSELSGISLRTLQDFEQGRRNLSGASALTVYKLSQVLGCKFSDLLGESSDDVEEKELFLTIRYKTGVELRNSVNYVHYENNSICFTINQKIHDAVQDVVKIDLNYVDSFDTEGRLV